MKTRVVVVEMEGAGADILPQLSAMLGNVVPVVVPAGSAPPAVVNHVQEVTPALPAPQTKTEDAEVRVPERKPPVKIAAPAARSAEKPVRQSGVINWKLYVIRTAQGELSPCVICKQPIRKGDRYRDGCIESRRAHVLCVVEVPEAEKEDAA